MSVPPISLILSLVDKGSASARKPPLPPRRQRMDEKGSAAVRKPPLPPRRQRMDEKGSAAARNPPLPRRRKRMDEKARKSPLPPRQRMDEKGKSALPPRETSNRTWIADQLRSMDKYIKLTSNMFNLLSNHTINTAFAELLLSLCKVDQNLWADHLTHHLIQYIVMKLQASTQPLDADADASPSKKLKGS
ncbi:hypothetical protein AAHA92_24662 [Salvia divinorum]|uniref:Uncharacterized protein n=1 Tax=Salvia divinorum TaxID=28513 RepID=A0ABD1GB87_SALDI